MTDTNEADVKHEISVKKPKGKKAKAELKVVKTKRTPTVFYLSAQNRKYVDYYRGATHASFNILLNAAIDHARATDILKNVEVKEPKSVAKARALLERWAKVPTAGKKNQRAKASNE